MSRTLSVAAFSAALLVPAAALAHHGWAGQDNAKVTTLEGRVDAVRYRNPHGERLAGCQRYVAHMLFMRVFWPALKRSMHASSV